MIRLVNVVKTYGSHPVLDGVNLTVQKGEIMVIIGPSGSGKSTLLRLMIGLTRPSAGEIWIGDQEISSLPEDGLNKIRRHMGMVFQNAALFDSLTVGENVAFGLRQHTSLSDAEIARIVARRLKMVGLAGQENVMPSELSGGMKKRVGLARAMALNPDIVLYDEPTAGLDPIMASSIDRLICRARRIYGVTSVVVTHDMASAFKIADRIAFLYDHRITAVGTVEEIKNSPDPAVQQFIHGWLSPRSRR